MRTHGRRHAAERGLRVPAHEGTPRGGGALLGGRLHFGRYVPQTSRDPGTGPGIRISAGLRRAVAGSGRRRGELQMGGLPRGAVAARTRSADRGVADRPGQDSAHTAGHGRNLGRIPYPRRLRPLRRAAAQAVGVPRTLQGHRQHLQQCLRLQRPEALDHERLFPPARPARPLRGGLQRQRCRLRQLRQGGRREETHAHRR